MLLPTLSLYLHGQSLSEREIGLVFGSFTVSAITFRLLASRLSSIFGTLAVVRLGFLVCAMGAVCFVLVRHMGFYFLARLMQGAGFAVSSTLLVSVASAVIPPRRLGEGIGYLGLGATRSLALGPVLGLNLAHSRGFTVMFLVSASTCVAATLISLFLPKPQNPPGAAARGPRPGGWLERRAVPASILMFVYGAGVSSITVFLAIYCELNGLPSAASFFMVSTVGTVVARLFAGRIYDREGHLFVIPPAVVMLLAALVAIIMIPPRGVMYTVAVIYGLGAGTVFPSVQTLALASVPPDRHTIAAAYFFVAFDLGIGLGTVFLGFVAGFFHDYKSAFVGSMAFFSMFMALYFLLIVRGRKRAGA
jgi:MFS family permease